jgi:hypothetical protein
MTTFKRRSGQLHQSGPLQAFGIAVKVQKIMFYKGKHFKLPSPSFPPKRESITKKVCLSLQTSVTCQNISSTVEKIVSLQFILFTIFSP